MKSGWRLWWGERLEYEVQAWMRASVGNHALCVDYWLKWYDR